jgi:putative transposase
MPRANRHYIPGQIWHLTHRCHDRQFLLRAEDDRRAWTSWVREARSRYGLCVLDYCVTNNHTHLLVHDTGKPHSIARSVQLIAGRTAQQYNERKGRGGAFWEDRYHATAVQSGEHLRQCIGYIALNMVRAGVVKDPSLWPFCGHADIQSDRRRNCIIDSQDLMRLLNVTTPDELRQTTLALVKASAESKGLERQSQWTEAVAVGDRDFVDDVKTRLGVRAKSRASVEGSDGVFYLREDRAVYGADLEVKTRSIGLENGRSWHVFPEESMSY